MKKQRTKLRKFLIRTLLFLLLLIGLTGVLSRSKTVQTYLAQKAAQWLSKELKVKVLIGSLEFDFFRNIHLERVFLGDRVGDTLIAAGSINLELVKYDGKLFRVVFGRAALKEAFVNIGYHKGHVDKNIDFLLDYINGPKTKKTGPPKIWTIEFQTADLTDCDFHYFDESKQATEPGFLDEFNLHFRKINGTLQDLRIVDDSLHFQAVNLSTTERSGLFLKQMNSDCNIHFKGMDFTNLDLVTNCSHLRGELHFAYPGYNHLDEFVSNTTWRGDIRNSTICLGELSIFSGELKGHKEKLTVNRLKIRGTFDHLKLTNADISTGKDTRLQGDFYMEGLPDWRTTKCNFQIAYLRTNASDLEKILNGMKLPLQLHDAGNIIAKGDFKGKFLNFEWRGTLESALGNATTDVAMNLEPGMEKAEFSGRIMTESFDLSKFEKSLGVTALDVTLDGTGLDAAHFDATIDARLPQFTIMGRSYSDAIIQGDLTATNFNGKAQFNDLRLNSDFEGEIDFTDEIPRFDFKATARGLDLYEVGADSVHTLVWGTAVVKAAGLNPDQFQGSVEMQDLNIHRLGKVYDYRYQYIQKTGTNKNTNIGFHGDLVTGNIRGNFSLANVDAIVINSMAEVFPERITIRKDYTGRDSFYFDIALHDPALVYSFVAPELVTNPLHISGDYIYSKRQGHFDLQQIDVHYGQYEIKNLEVHANLSSENGLHLEAAASALWNQGAVQLTNFGVSSDVLDGSAVYNLKLSDKTGKYVIDVDATSQIYADSITIAFANSNLKMDKEIWTVDTMSRLVLYNDGSILSHELYLDGVNHYIEAKGMISAKQKDTLMVDLGNFGVDFIRPFLKKSALDSLEGKINGTVYISGLLGKPRFSGNISGRNIRFYGVDYGDADIAINDLDASGRLSVKTNFLNGLLRGVVVDGNVRYLRVNDKDAMNLLIQIPEGTSVTILQPFLVDVLTWKSGVLNGQVNIQGSFEKPEITGDIYLKNARAQVDYLQTSYNFDAEFVVNSKGIFNTKPIYLHDETGTGIARTKLSITHNNFENFYMDLRIDSAVNLKCLNTTEKDGEIYFGKAWADGYCHIYGPFDRISMDINLKSRKNSKITLLYSDVEQNELLGYITFGPNDDTKGDTIRTEVPSVLHKINIALDVNPDLEAEFVIDKRLGDVIRGRGRGLLRMQYDEDENFYLFGTYRVSEGDYVFSLPGINLLTKKIALQPGGTVTWTGDPYNAILNMTGSFEKRISPAALMTAVGNQKSYAPIKVRSILYLTGNLFSPDIRFDIQAPELENSTASSSNDVYRVIQRIRSDKDETMRQAVALLLFGNFITPSFAQGASTGSGISGTGVAGNSISSIASSVVNDIFTRIGIPTRIQVNIDDVRSSRGTANTQLFISSETFLTERVRLDVNYDPTSATMLNNIAVPLNFKLEYQTRNENWRFNAFSRSSNLLLQQSSTTLTTGVSGNTLGAGVIYRREFETFKRPLKILDTTQIR